MSSIREVLFKVEREVQDNEGATYDSHVLFVSTSFDRALQWARDHFGIHSWEVNVISYVDANAFDFTWLSSVPVLVWRHVYTLETGECMMTNLTASEERRANDLAEWQDECAAAASWIA